MVLRPETGLDYLLVRDFERFRNVRAAFCSNRASSFHFHRSSDFSSTGGAMGPVRITVSRNNAFRIRIVFSDGSQVLSRPLRIVTFEEVQDGLQATMTAKAGYWLETSDSRILYIPFLLMQRSLTYFDPLFIAEEVL